MFTFFMIVAGAGMMLSLIAFLVSRAELKDLEVKLESQRQKREIDECKRVHLVESAKKWEGLFAEQKQHFDEAMSRAIVAERAIAMIRDVINDKVPNV
jgi:hypothetical protein